MENNYPNASASHHYAHTSGHPHVGIAAPPPKQDFPGHSPVAGTDWTTGLCACFEDPGNCCLTCCCPCVTVGLIAEILDKGATSCTMGAVIYTVLHLASVPCIYSCSYRKKLRRLFKLDEGSWGDCVVHCCCDYCAICQEYRELKNRGLDPSIGWKGNLNKWNVGELTTKPPDVAAEMFR